MATETRNETSVPPPTSSKDIGRINKTDDMQQTQQSQSQQRQLRQLVSYIDIANRELDKVRRTHAMLLMKMANVGEDVFTDISRIRVGDSASSPSELPDYTEASRQPNTFLRESVNKNELTAFIEKCKTSKTYTVESLSKLRVEDINMLINETRISPFSTRETLSAEEDAITLYLEKAQDSSMSIGDDNSNKRTKDTAIKSAKDLLGTYLIKFEEWAQTLAAVASGVTETPVSLVPISSELFSIPGIIATASTAFLSEREDFATLSKTFTDLFKDGDQEYNVYVTLYRFIKGNAYVDPPLQWATLRKMISVSGRMQSLTTNQQSAITTYLDTILTGAGSSLPDFPRSADRWGLDNPNDEAAKLLVSDYIQAVIAYSNGNIRETIKGKWEELGRLKTELQNSMSIIVTNYSHAEKDTSSKGHSGLYRKGTIEARDVRAYDILNSFCMREGVIEEVYGNALGHKGEIVPMIMYGFPLNNVDLTQAVSDDRNTPQRLSEDAAAAGGGWYIYQPTSKSGDHVTDELLQAYIDNFIPYCAHAQRYKYNEASAIMSSPTNVSATQFPFPHTVPISSETYATYPLRFYDDTKSLAVNIHRDGDTAMEQNTIFSFIRAKATLCNLFDIYTTLRESLTATDVRLTDSTDPKFHDLIETQKISQKISEALSSDSSASDADNSQGLLSSIADYLAKEKTADTADTANTANTANTSDTAVSDDSYPSQDSTNTHTTQELQELQTRYDKLDTTNKALQVALQESIKKNKESIQEAQDVSHMNSLTEIYHNATKMRENLIQKQRILQRHQGIDKDTRQLALLEKELSRKLKTLKDAEDDAIKYSRKQEANAIEEDINKIDMLTSELQRIEGAIKDLHADTYNDHTSAMHGGEPRIFFKKTKKQKTRKKRTHRGKKKKRHKTVRR